MGNLSQSFTEEIIIFHTLRKSILNKILGMALENPDNAEDTSRNLGANDSSIFQDSPDLDTTELLPDVATFMFEEAVKYYGSKYEPPPFLHHRLVKAAPGDRLRVRIATGGKLLKGAREADLIARPWDAQSNFWTLDLSGRRWIVKVFKGGPQGTASYRCWQGISHGFSELVVAFSIPKTQPALASLGAGEQTVESDGDLPVENARESQRRRRLVRKNTNTFSSAQTEMTPEEKEQLVDDLLTPSTSPNPGRPSGSEARILTLKVPKKSMRSPKLYGTPRSARRLLAETSAHRSVGKRRSKRRVDDLYTPNGLHRRTTRNGPPSERPTPRSTRSEKIKRFDEELSKEPLKAEYSLVHANETSLSDAPLPGISPRKLEKTTFYLSHPRVTAKMGIKLRSCPTITAFFTSISAFLRLHGIEDKVEAALLNLRATPGGDHGEIWLVARDFPDTFEVFLDTVDRGPMWEDEVSGRCDVDVEIFCMK